MTMRPNRAGLLLLVGLLAGAASNVSPSITRTTRATSVLVQRSWAPGAWLQAPRTLIAKTTAVTVRSIYRNLIGITTDNHVPSSGEGRSTTGNVGSFVKIATSAVGAARSASMR